MTTDQPKSFRDRVNHALYSIEASADSPSTNAFLTRVSRERGSIAESPLTWSWAGEAVGSDGAYEIPSHQEIAAGVALRLYARHRKATRRSPLTSDRFGTAVGRIALSDVSLEHRLQALSTATDIRDVEVHLWALISMMTGGNGRSPIGFDYARLADSLLRWQDINQRALVTSQWARDTYMNKKKANS